MKKLIFFFSAALLIPTYLFIIRPLFFNQSKQAKVIFPKQVVEVKVEVADTVGKRQRGLMYRKKLEQLHGMLFVFSSSGEHSFWMKNTYISLDMIHISQNKKVVDCIENATPCEKDDCPAYTPKQMSKYVLEVNSGFCERYNIAVGDQVELQGVE